MRRLAVLLAVALGILLAIEQPAAAHGPGGVEATNYETTLSGVSPALAGVRVRVIEAGRRLELRNRGPELVILGYQDEPYLRVGPDGTFENRRSPAASLNRDRRPDPHLPVPSESAEPPDWGKVSDEPVARWHDHRIHWMGAHDPPQVEARPDVRQVVQPWAVTLQRGAESAIVSGQLTWVPGPSPTPWLGLVAATFLGVGALGLLRRWGPPLAAAVGLLLAADIVHALAAASASPGGVGAHLIRVVAGSFYSVVGWVLAAVALRLLARSRVDGLFAGVFAGLSVAVFGGLLDVATLSRRVTPFALPIEVARLCVALAVGGGLGLTTACLLVIRRTPAARRVLAGPDDGDEDRSDGGGDRDHEADGTDTSAPPAPDSGARLEVGGRAGPAG